MPGLSPWNFTDWLHTSYPSSVSLKYGATRLLLKQATSCHMSRLLHASLSLHQRGLTHIFFLKVLLVIHKFRVVFTLNCDYFPKLHQLLSPSWAHAVLSVREQLNFWKLIISKLYFNLSHVFLRVFRFLLVSIIEQMLHTHIHVNITLSTRTKEDFSRNQCRFEYPGTLDRKNSCSKPRR